MYLKLMVRGILRHRKSGARLFVLLALCSAAVLFFLAFRDSYSSRYQQLVIDVSTSHLQIVPSNSPKLSPDGSCTDHREGLTTLFVTEEMDQYLRSIPEITGTMLAIETRASLFTLEGEPTGAAYPLVGVDTRTFEATLPAVRVVQGMPMIKHDPVMKDIPVFRPVPELSEIVTDNDRFVRDNFRAQGTVWDEFKGRVRQEIPALFVDRANELTDEIFLASMNAALERADLPTLLPDHAGRKYDYRTDDALAELATASESVRTQDAGLQTIDRVQQQKVLRKRLLQSLYPDVITPVRDAISLNTQYTMVVPPARDNGRLGGEAVLPVSISAFVQRLPLFRGQNYIDGDVLRDRLGLRKEEGTNVYIRLASSTEMPGVKKKIQAWLAAQGLPYVVKDYHELGKLYMSTSGAFEFITLVMIALFVVTVVIFVVNTVLLAVIQRKREIGTSIAIGMSPAQNIVVIFGEIAVFVLLSWTAGSIIGSGVIALFHVTGIPGIVFMPGGKLFLDFRFTHFLISISIILSMSCIASLIPLRRLAGVKPVDLLKEAA